MFDNIKDSRLYDAASDYYVIGAFGGAGGGPSYFLDGYTSDGNNEYTLHFKHCQAFWGTDIPALIQEYNDYVGHDLTAAEQEDWLYQFSNGKYALISPEEHTQNLKFRVSYDGQYVRFVSSEVVATMPAVSDLINWSTYFFMEDTCYIFNIANKYLFLLH